MKKLVAFILVLALCLSLCSVAFATPAPEAPSSCNINILHAIGTYWIARTIIERAKEIKVETVNLSDFLKLALPVGIAAVGTAATVGILYALLKGNCDKDDADTIKTVKDILDTVDGGFPTGSLEDDGLGLGRMATTAPDGAWVKENTNVYNYGYAFILTKDDNGSDDDALVFQISNQSGFEGLSEIGEYIFLSTQLEQDSDNWKGAINSSANRYVTFIMSEGKLIKIVLESAKSNLNGEYDAPPQ